jgi:hypothetical protein
MTLLEKKVLEKIVADYLAGYNELSNAVKELDNNVVLGCSLSSLAYEQIRRIQDAVYHYGYVKE